MYTIEISNGKQKIYEHRQHLAAQGMKFVKRSYGKSFYTKKVSEEEKEELIEYCKENGLKYSVIENAYIRNSSYRNDFLKQYDRRKYVICAYCGLPVRKDKLTVDHIIPVDKAKKGKGGARLLMKILKIKDVNCTKNLAAACKRCNSRKRTKMGIWIVRGFVGKSRALWVIRWILRLVLVLLLVYFIYQLSYVGIRIL